MPSKKNTRTEWLTKSVKESKRKLKKHKEELRKLTIICLVFLLVLGAIWILRFDPESQTLDGYRQELKEKGFVYTERAQAGSEKANASDLSDFDTFLRLAQREQANRTYIDKGKRVLYFFPAAEERTKIVRFYYGPDFDWGALWTAGLTALVLFVVGFPSWVYGKTKDCSIERRPFVLMLAVAGVIGIWFAVRAIVLRFYENITTEGLIYNQSDIFQILSILITANLPLTLVKAFTLAEEEKKKSTHKKQEAGNDNQERQEKPEAREDESGRVLKGLVDVVIQAIMIALITLVGGYRDQNFLMTIGGSSSFVFVFASMLTALLIAVLTRGMLFRQVSRENGTCTRTRKWII